VREVVRDTTRIDEEELRRLRRRLEELETMQDQLASRAGRMPIDEKMQALLNMAGGVGHVFNNVLAGILGRTQLLVKRASREKSREIASGIHEIEVATRSGIDALARIQEFSRSRPAGHSPRRRTTSSSARSSRRGHGGETSRQRGARPSSSSPTLGPTRS
jgi:signal transduction histidine kinase